MIKAICPKCLEFKVLIEHHVFIRHFYRKSKDLKKVIFLCEKCHVEIHEILPNDRRLKKEEYIDIHKAWFSGENILVTGG